jgi:type I restriction enzyme, R subunit
VPPDPEALARSQIDDLLARAGWALRDFTQADIHAARVSQFMSFRLRGCGFADYLLYVDGKSAGVIEAKKQGVPLTEVELRSAICTGGLPASLPAWTRPLPSSYQSTGTGTSFTSGPDPGPDRVTSSSSIAPNPWLIDSRA